MWLSPVEIDNLGGDTTRYGCEEGEESAKSGFNVVSATNAYVARPYSKQCKKKDYRESAQSQYIAGGGATKKNKDANNYSACCLF